MVVGILQIEIKVDGSRSLKDKRRVVVGLKDRLHREHQVSVAEVDGLDNPTTAVLGITMASNDARHCQSTLDRLLDKIRFGRDYEMIDHKLEILTGH